MSRLMSFVCGLVAVVGMISCGEAGEVSKPNFLFICVDDMRPELGCYGAGHVKSPNLDQLSKSGVTFDRCYVQVAVCNPSRASMMTGIRPDRLGVWNLLVHFREATPDAVTIPQYLRKHGYQCEGLGKIFHNPWQDPRSWDEPHRWGGGSYTNYTEEQNAFTEKVGKTLPEASWQYGNLRGPATNAPDIDDMDHSDGKMTQLAIDRMRELGGQEKPFFLAVGFTLPHLPWCPPKRYWDLYDREAIPLASNAFPPKNAPKVAVGTNYELTHYADMVSTPAPFDGSLPESDVRRLRHGYLAAISFVDTQIGKLLAALEEQGRGKDTVVVFWSDHGYKQGEHNGWTKMTNYEIDTRIPFIIRDPRAKGNGERCEGLVETLDLYPTFCELAGIEKPDFVEGKSLAHLLNDPKEKHKDAAFSQFTRDGMMGASIRTEGWRFVEWRSLKTGETELLELYDEVNDPQENENIAGTKPEIEKELSAELRKVLVPHPISLKPGVFSKPRGEKVAIKWVNAYPGRVRITWVNAMGQRKNPFEMRIGGAREGSLIPGQVFAVESLDGKYFETVTVSDEGGEMRLGG